MASKNFKARVGLEAPLIAAEDGTTALTLSSSTGAVTVAGDLTINSGYGLIKKAGGTTVIALDFIDQTIVYNDVNILGNLEIGSGNVLNPPQIKSISSVTSYPVTAITLDDTNVIVAGDLTVTDAVKFNGATSGTVTIAAPATAGTQSYTLPTALPAVTGYVLSGTTGGALSWVSNSDANTTYDFNATTATGGANLNLVGSDSTTDTVKLTNGGHITAAYTSGTAVTLGSDATNANTASTIVARDASGNFSAGTITAALSGNATSATTAATATQVANSLTAGTHLSGGPFDGSAAVTLTTDATDANTASTIVARDASGNFSAGTVTANSTTIGASAGTVSTSSGNLTVNTVNGTNSGSMVITAGANGAITLAPNGTGSVVNTFSNGGNLTNNRNYVFGAIRNATTASIGDMWALNATGTVQPFRGVSLDNSADTTKNAGYLARNYASTAGGRSRLIFERARGTAASPAAVQSGDFLGEVDVTGYTSTGWLSDNIITGGGVPGFFGFTAAENWVSNTAIGTAFSLNLAPTSTTITSAANLTQVLALAPQANTYRADTHSFTAGKSGTYGMMDLNGNRANFTLPIKFAAFLATAVNDTLATTAATGTGSVATLTFGALASAPFTVGSQVIVAGVTPAGYNGTVTVTACTTTSVSYTSTATGAQTVAGTIKVAGAIGWQIAISDSPTVGGRMAFWDTTNSRFSYISDNSAV